MALGALTGCPDPDQDTDALVDSGNHDAAADSCDVTWENFGQAFLVTNCQPCHASDTEERFDAPEDVVFDVEEDAELWASRILARSSGSEPTMPPAGGVAESDRALLEEWLTCAYGSVTSP